MGTDDGRAMPTTSAGAQWQGMADITTTTTTKAERVTVGQPYKSYRWRDGSDGGTVLMHPECREAMHRTSREEGGWIDWEQGENHRGKSWGEAGQT
jgi:hypothetical protein